MQKWVTPDPQSMRKARRVDAAALTKLLVVRHVLPELFLPDCQKRLAEASVSTAFLQLQRFCSPIAPSFEIISSGRLVDEQLAALVVGNRNWLLLAANRVTNSLNR